MGPLTMEESEDVREKLKVSSTGVTYPVASYHIEVVSFAMTVTFVCLDLLHNSTVQSDVISGRTPYLGNSTYTSPFIQVE